jgi:hypothetical protein
MRLPKCKICKKEFKPFQSTQQVCGWECAQKFAEQKRLKKERKEYREARERLKTTGDWIADVQAVFNRYIRLRDEALPCVSCGRTEVEWTRGGRWDAGHFLSVGSHPELRFHEDNVHKQCKKCNGGAGKYAKKNYSVSAAYEIELISRIGQKKVDRLKGMHEPAHYTIDDLKDLKKLYQKKYRELQDKLVSN